MTELNLNHRDLIYNEEKDIAYMLSSHSTFLEKYNFSTSVYEKINLYKTESEIISISPDIFNLDSYMSIHSSFGLLGNIFYIVRDTVVNGKIINHVTTYNNEFEQLDQKRFVSGIEFNLSQPFINKSSVIFYGYEGDGFYELPIKNGRIGELRPFLRD